MNNSIIAFFLGLCIGAGVMSCILANEDYRWRKAYSPNLNTDFEVYAQRDLLYNYNKLKKK